MAQGITNLDSAVDTRLVQNDRRNNLQEGFLGELCTAMTNIASNLEKNTQDTQQMNQRSKDMQQRMEEMSNASNGEFGKSIASVTIRCEARLADVTKAHASSSSVAVTGGAQSIVPPCLGFGGDDRNSGVGNKKAQPPVTKWT